MRKKTHIKLANRIISKVGIDVCSEEAASKLVDASIVPDEWKDYPHHYGKEGSIRSRIIQSRKCWLEKDKENCGFHLGVAFHYLADKWTLMHGSDPRHSSWEQSISTSFLSDDLHQVVQFSGISDSDRANYYKLLEKLSKEPMGKDETLHTACLKRPSKWSTPSMDLNIAYNVCLRVAQSVFSSPTPPLEVREKIEKSSKTLESMLSKSRYRIFWFSFLPVLCLGMIPLLSVNFNLFLPLFSAMFCIEAYSIRMFMLDDLSDFKKIQAIREVGYAWVFMAIIFIVLILYGGFHLISGDLLTQAATLILIVSLWGQKYLQWYPIKKSEADKLYTYIDWFVDVKDVQKECPKESSSTDEPYSEAMQVQDNQLYIYCCSQCMMRYVSHRSSEKCPQCGALNIQ